MSFKDDYPDEPRHESHGLIRLARCQGRVNLFGSPIVPLHFMELEITEGQAYHGGGDRRYMDGPCIAQVYMSEMQFAELITTPNSGVGTPCTLRYAREGDTLRKYEEPPVHESEASLTRKEFHRKVKERLATMSSARRKITNLLGEAKIGKKRSEEILDAIHGIMRLFEDSAPYYAERFEENVETVIATAKAEITSHAHLEAQRVGIEALKAGPNVPLLEGPE